MERLFLSPGLVLFFVGIVSVVVNRIFFYSEFQSVHYIYLFGCVAFSLLYGYVRCLHFFSGFKLSTSIEPPLVNKNLIKLYKIISIVGAVIGVAVIVKFGVLGGGGIVYNLRYRHTYEGSGNYGASYCAVFALVVSLLSILQKKIKDSFFILLHFLSLQFLLVRELRYFLESALFFMFRYHAAMLGSNICFLQDCFLLPWLF